MVVIPLLAGHCGLRQSNFLGDLIRPVSLPNPFDPLLLDFLADHPRL
jgi:hypothetical protein